MKQQQQHQVLNVGSISTVSDTVDTRARVQSSACAASGRLAFVLAGLKKRGASRVEPRYRTLNSGRLSCPPPSSPLYIPHCCTLYDFFSSFFLALFCRVVFLRAKRQKQNPPLGGLKKTYFHKSNERGLGCDTYEHAKKE